MTGKEALNALEQDGVFIKYVGSIPKIDDKRTVEHYSRFVNIIKKDLHKLEELTKTPTLEEVKKEWEELGYEWRIPKEYPHMIWLVDDDEEEKLVLRIKINTQSKTYWKLWGDGGFDKFTF